MSELPPVLFNDFQNSSDFEDLDAISRVVASGHLILGKEVRAFEEAWAARCGVNWAVGLGNGLDAIEVGLRAAGIGVGDEVITSPMTAVATVLGILRAGATPVLADINPETALLDPASVQRCISPATRAVLLVHLYGQMRDMEVWSELCVSNGLMLIEDCAQAHDAIYQQKTAGTWGRFGAYSFYPTKNLGAVGDAGAIITNDGELAVRACSLRNYGQSNRYEHPFIGLNSRLDEIQAAVLTARLEGLGSRTMKRRQTVERYRSEISNPAVKLLSPPISPENHANHLFVILTEDRVKLSEHLAERGISSLIHYPIPAHQQESLRGLERDPSGLGNAESHASKCLSLPCAPHLSDIEASRVIDAVNQFQSSSTF